MMKLSIDQCTKIDERSAKLLVLSEKLKLAAKMSIWIILAVAVSSAIVIVNFGGLYITGAFYIFLIIVTLILMAATYFTLMCLSIIVGALSAIIYHTGATAKLVEYVARNCSFVKNEND